MEKQISVKISESKHAAVKALAKKRHYQIFYIIDRALARYLSDQEKSK